MMMHELIDIFNARSGAIDGFEVVVATTIVDGTRLESGVAIRSIAKLEVDDIGPEIVMYPPGFVDEPDLKDKRYLVKDFRDYPLPTSEDYELMAVDRMKQLPAGRVAIATNPIIGALWYEEDSQLWLLQSPKDQWPSEWFA